MAAANSTSSIKCEVRTSTVTLSSKFCATCGTKLKLDEDTQALNIVSMKDMNMKLFCAWKWRMIIAVIFQLKKLERRSLKKSGLRRDSDPRPPRYRCDTNWAMRSQGARSIYWVYISRAEWNDVKYIWSHIWTAGVNESEEWSSQWISKNSE